VETNSLDLAERQLPSSKAKVSLFIFKEKKELSFSDSFHTKFRKGKVHDLEGRIYPMSKTKVFLLKRVW